MKFKIASSNPWVTSSNARVTSAKPRVKISLYVCILSKQYPENFTFLILRILELFAVNFVNFLKSRLIFNIFYIFECLWTNFSHDSSALISESKRCFNVKSSTYYFHMKKKIVANFQVYISVPLSKFWGRAVFHSVNIFFC